MIEPSRNHHSCLTSGTVRSSSAGWDGRHGARPLSLTSVLATAIRVPPPLEQEPSAGRRFGRQLPAPAGSIAGRIIREPIVPIACPVMRRAGYGEGEAMEL